MKSRLLVRLRLARTFSIAVFAMTAASLGASGQNPSAQPNPAAPDWSGVEQALGRKGTTNPGGVIRFSFPRSDLSVTVGGVALKPALALGGWVAFKELTAGQALVNPPGVWHTADSGDGGWIVTITPGLDTEHRQR